MRPRLTPFLPTRSGEEPKKGKGGFLGQTCENQFTTVKLTLTLPWKNYLTSFRVFYEVDHAEKAVSILAIGVKEGNQLFIGGQEFEL